MNNPFVRPEICAGLRAGHDPLCHIQREHRTTPSGLRHEHYLATSVSWLVGAALVFAAFACNASDIGEATEVAAPTEALGLTEPTTAATAQTTAAILAATPDLAPATSEPSVHMGLAVASDTLDSSRGGTEVQLSDIRVQGSLHDASASELQTGSNLITTGAFANTVGFPMTIQNSGNNVLIQNATIINVTPY